MSTPSNLSAICSDLLAFCVDALGARAPDRQYIQAGLVAADGCDQLTVMLAPNGVRFSPGAITGPSAQSARQPQVPVVDLQVMATCCVPSLPDEAITGRTLPSPADIQDAAEEIMADGEVLLCALFAAARAGSIFGGCRLTAVSQMAPYGPSGGVGGVTITVTTQYSCPSPGS